MPTYPTYQTDGYFQSGSVVYPLPTATGNTALQDIDPVLYRMIEFYKGVLPLHLGAYWNQCVTQVGRADLLNIDWLNVGQAIHYAMPLLKSQAQYRFPLLSVFRDTERYQHLSIPKYETNANIQVIFALPPWAIEQLDVMDPFLKAVSNIILDRTFVGYDTNFNNGEPVWTESGLELIRIVKSQYGQLPSLGGEIQCRSVAITLEVHEERRIYYPQYSEYSGASLDIQFVGSSASDGYATNPPIDNFIDVSTQYPCEVISVSPATGPRLGGTLLTINGQGFVGQVGGVSVCGQPVSNFTVLGPNQIQLVTPPGNPGLGNIVVVSSAGTGFLHNAFTYDF